MNTMELRKQLVLASQRAYFRGIQTNNGGNVSARIPGTDYMLIKGSGTSFIDGGENDFVISDFDGNLVEGNSKPSRESKLHGFIYRSIPEAGSVVHTHSVYAIALANIGENRLPGVTHHSALKIRGSVPIFDVKTAAVQESDFPMLADAWENGDGKDAFILTKHGVVAMGKDPVAAEHMAELIEETAQIAVIEKLLSKA